MNELSEKTRTVARKFPKQWSTPIRYIDLVEEVGELANALLGKWNEKPKESIYASVEDSLCDILYDVILLAHDFNIDLDKAYTRMLQTLEKRIESGEFNEKAK